KGHLDNRLKINGESDAAHTGQIAAAVHKLSPIPSQKTMYLHENGNGRSAYLVPTYQWGQFHECSANDQLTTHFRSNSMPDEPVECFAEPVPLAQRASAPLRKTMQQQVGF